MSSLIEKFAFPITSAFIAETVTYPIDVTKTRLQIQGENSSLYEMKTTKVGMFRMGLDIYKNEGLKNGIYKGLSPSLLRHVVYSGLRINIYDWLRINRIGFKDVNSQGTELKMKAFYGFVAGGLAQFISSPTDLLKVQLQMEGRRKQLGESGRVNGLLDTFLVTLKKSGFRGLWAGASPNVVRACAVNLADLTTYDITKQYLSNHCRPFIAQSLASIASGIACGLLGTPADVIKTRMMNQPVDTKTGKGRFYSGSIDCGLKTVKREGILALYKGLIPFIGRIIPWTWTFWISFEKCLEWSGRKEW